MTNKPTWEEELKTLCEKYCNCIDAYIGRHMLDPNCVYHHIWQDGVIENFISTKLAEQKESLIKKIEEKRPANFPVERIQGYLNAMDDIINLINNK